MMDLAIKAGDTVRRIAGPDHRYKIGHVAVVVHVNGWTGEITLNDGGRTSIKNWWPVGQVPPKLVPEPEPAKLLLAGALELIALITYKPGWSIEAHQDDAQKVYVQLSVSAFAEASMDSVKRDGTRTPWKSSRRYLTPSMCKQELVGVIFDLIKAAELHEAHEWFRYKNASIYNPHLCPDALAVLSRKKESFVVRKNAMSMVEEAA